MKISRLFRVSLSGAFFLVSLNTFVTAQNYDTAFCDITPAWDKIHITSEKPAAGLTKIFFITNRPYVPNPEDGELFPNDIADFRKVSYMIATCDGSSWNLRFVKDFNEGMKEINDSRDILLFIEGHGKTLPMGMNRAFEIQQRYNVALVVFDWPSKNKNFNTSIARVRRCGDNFYNLLLQIKDYRSKFMNVNQRFSIIAHSLGNYFLTNLVVCGDCQYLQDKFIDNIIFNSAAVRSKEHGKVISQIKFMNRIYITSNKYDWVLHGADLLTAGRMLGIYPIKPLVTNAQYVNFTGLVGRQHSYYFGYHDFEHENPAFFYFYNTAVHGNEVNLKDTNYFLPRETDDGYNVKGISK
jgi:hypothetical protein